MGELFRHVLSASFYGGIVIIVVLCLRLLLKKAPKNILCLLWLLAAVRLLMPLEVESSFSLQPDLEAVTIPGTAQLQQITSSFDSGTGEEPLALPTEALPDTHPVQTPAVTPSPVVMEREVPLSALILENYEEILAWLWLCVAAGLLIYSGVAYLRLRRRVRDAVIVSEGVWQNGGLDTAFVLGFFRPQIYLPAGLSEQERQLVLLHERAHISRADPWWKLLGFAVLALHWFNPLAWAAYLCLCKDLEMACDERVVRSMDVTERKAYSAALLSCSVNRRSIAACPVAFGEVSVKARIKSVLNYRKPLFWVTILAVIAIVFVTVCFLTSPVEKVDPTTLENWGVTMTIKDPTPTGVTAEFDLPENADGNFIFSTAEWAVQSESGGEWVDMPILSDQDPVLAWNENVSWLYPNDEIQQVALDWTTVYGKLSPGRYRVRGTLRLVHDGLGYEKDFYAEFEITGDESSNEWGVALYASNVTAQGMTLVCQQDGTPVTGTLGTGSYYWLERQTDSGWTPVEEIPPEDGIERVWTSELRLITMGGTTHWGVNWSGLYGELSPGTYRLGKIISLTPDEMTGQPSETREVKLYAQFTVGDTALPALSREDALDMCIAAYESLQRAENYRVNVSTSADPFGIYHYIDGEDYYIDKLTQVGYNTLMYHGKLYFYVQQDYMEDKEIPTGWMSDNWAKAHYPAVFDGEREQFFWENTGWESLALELRTWERQEDGITLTFTEEGDYDRVWTFTLDEDGNLTGITFTPDRIQITKWTFAGIGQAYIADQIRVRYASAYRETPDAVIVRDQAFYEELFTRKTDGHYTEKWISHLFEALYAQPEEFTRQLSRKYGEDPKLVQSVLTMMGYHVQWYEPERFTQILEEMRNVPELDQAILDLMAEYLQGE